MQKPWGSILRIVKTGNRQKSDAVGTAAQNKQGGGTSYNHYYTIWYIVLELFICKNAFLTKQTPLGLTKFLAP